MTGGEEAGQDHYSVLDVAYTADRQQVDEAYERVAVRLKRELADQPSALREAFRRLNDAHSVLIVPQRRAEYDRSLGIARLPADPLPTREPYPPTDTRAPRDGADGGRARSTRSNAGTKWGCTVVALILFGLIAAGGFWFVSTCGQVIGEGREAVDEFHRLYEVGDYRSIYAAMDPDLQQAMAMEGIVIRLDEMKSRLGAVKRVEFACMKYADMSGNEKLLRLEYRVGFDRGEAWETYDWRYDRGKPRLLAYAVETGWEDEPPAWEIILAPGKIRPNTDTCTEFDDLLWWER